VIVDATIMDVVVPEEFVARTLESIERAKMFSEVLCGASGMT
jgi:hypothetical protein